VVSARSAAMNRMRPAGTSRTAETGAGVSNFCIVLSFFCSVRSFGPLFLMMESYVAFKGLTTDSLRMIDIIAGRSR